MPLQQLLVKSCVEEICLVVARSVGGALAAATIINSFNTGNFHL